MTSGASAASTVPLRQGCFALGTGTGCEVGRRVQGRGLVRWHGSALPGDAERVCVCVRVRHPAPPTSAWNGGLAPSRHVKQVGRAPPFLPQPRNLRCSCTHFQGPAARHLRRSEFPLPKPLVVSIHHPPFFFLTW